MKLKVSNFFSILLCLGMLQPAVGHAQGNSSMEQANNYSISPSFGATQKKQPTFMI